MSIPAERILESNFADSARFEEWEWGDADFAPLLKHIRVDTAKIIAEQIQDDCRGWFSEYDGLFNITLGGDFVVSFDILKALAVGQIEFDQIDQLKAFSGQIDAVSANLHKAINYAEEAMGGEPGDPPPS